MKIKSTQKHLPLWNRRYLCLTFSFLFFLNILSLRAEGKINQIEKVSFKLKKATLKTVFKKIESQTNFTFFYENDIINTSKKVSINANNMAVNQVLGIVLEGTNTYFKILDKQIIIKRKTNNLLKSKSSSNTSSSSYDLIKTITGQVTSNGLPLPAVSIIVKRNGKGTQTDFDGNYTIEADEGDILEFSSIGYKNAEATVGSESVINIELEEDIATLNEVIVIGYGTARKKDLTGAVGVLGNKELAKFPVADATSVIQGRVAGVSVQSDGGAPGANQFVTIRGSSTLSDQGALFVIDGVFFNNMNSINPADIESISILKDASALAIYGSRAANGVVLITTKKGKKGKLGIDIEQSYGFQKVINTLPWANAREYANIVNTARDNDDQPRFTGLDTAFDPSIDSDVESTSLRIAPIANTNLRIYGGSGALTYNLSANILENEGIVRETDFTRKTFRTNSTFEKGKFKLQNVLGFASRKTNPNPYFNRERDLVPVIPIRDANGEFTGRVPSGEDIGLTNIRNSLGLATIEDRTVTDESFSGNLNASYEFIEGLTFKLNFGLNYGVNNNYRFSPKYDFSDSDVGKREVNELREVNTVSKTTLLENTLNYKRTFDKHTIDAIFGVTEQKFNSRSFGGVARDFANEDVRVLSAGLERAQLISRDNTSILQSYLGRLNYSYDDRYFFTASYRRDGSSLFGEGNKFNNYPSFALAWNLSNEAFMENFTALNNIKLRGSYGQIGNNNVNAYELVATLNINANYPIGGETLNGFAVTDPVNPDLLWETTTQTDIGIEFTALDEKLNVTMDYFNKNSEDVVVEVQSGLITGRPGEVPFNIGNITNKGFEFSVGYSNSIGDLNYGISGNMTFLDNEVTKIGPDGGIPSGSISSNTTNTTFTDVGQPVSSFYGYVIDGIYQTEEEATAAAPNVNGAPVAGDFRFKDIDGDGDVDEDDQTFLGSPIPTFEYGFNINLDYKNFDMTLFFNGVTGNEIVNGTKYRGFFDNEGNFFSDATNAWRPDNTNTNIPRNTFSDNNNNKRASDFFVEDGSYFRLRNIQLGYTIPKDITDAIKISKVRIYASAQNLFTITNYTGYYPEVGRNQRNGGNPNLLSSGVDESAYPTARTFQAGVQISF